MMKEAIDILRENSKNIGITLDDNQLKKFEIYMQLLLEYNSHTNITAITEPSQIAVKHFLDSLILLKAIEIKPGNQIIDVGTGAGFPGMPLKILVPDIKLTLLDSLNKRIKFLELLSKGIGVEAQITHKRAEEAGSDKAYRQTYNLAVSRAVASLNILVEYCLPFVRIGGYFAAMKGPDVEQELTNAKSAIKTLGGGSIKVQKFELPDSKGKRSIILIKKEKATPDEYPRNSQKIAKKPL